MHSFHGDARRNQVFIGTILSSAPKETIHHTIYNVTSFRLSAEEFRTWVLKYFPTAKITFNQLTAPGDCR